MHHDASDLCACNALRKAARAVTRSYDGALTAHGVSISQFAILRTLQRQGDMPLSRLAERMVMDRTSLYRALRPMQRRGWLDVRGGDAGKAKQAVLLPAGRALADAASADWDAAQARFVAHLGPEQWSSLQPLLARLAALDATVPA